MQKPLPSAGPTVGAGPAAGANPAAGGGMPSAGPTIPVGSAGGTLPPGLSGAPTIPLTPQEPEEQDQAQDQVQEAEVSPTAPFRGWYPRWWLLSAISCALLLGLVFLAQITVCQRPPLQTSTFCQVVGWSTLTGWPEVWVVAFIWLLFFTGWLLYYIFGVGPIVMDRSRHLLPGFFRSISEFRSVYPLLVVYATVSLLAIFVMWRRGTVPVLAYSLCSIVVFVANSHFFYLMKRSRERRRYLLGYAVLSIVLIAWMVRFGPFDPVILVAEILVVLVAPAIAFRRSQDPVPAHRPLTPDEQLALKNEEARDPGNVFLDLLRSGRRRP